MEGFKEFQAEGRLLKKLGDMARGFDKEAIQKKVNSLSDAELKSIVSHANPKSAQRVLHPKDYTLWKAAYDKLNEATKGEEEKFHKEVDKLMHKTFGHSEDEKKEKKKAKIDEVSNRLARKVIDRGLDRGVKAAGKTVKNADGSRDWQPPSDADKALAKKGAKSANLGYRQMDRNRRRGVTEAKIPEELAKDLGPFGEFATAYDESDKGIMVQFSRPLSRQELQQVANRLKMQPGVKLGNMQNAYHFNEEVEIDEALNVSQRLKRGIMMRRNKNKIKIGQQRARRRVANKEVLMKRAKKAARSHFFKKMTSGKSKDEINLAARQSIEKRLDAKGPAIEKFAMRLYPKMKKKEMERKKSSAGGDNK
jgi:hypothetical protein